MTSTTTTTTTTPRSHHSQNGAIHRRFKKIHSLNDLSNKTHLVNKYWNSMYNPLPFGGPRSSIQLAEEVEASFRMKQASGLPVARIEANKEKDLQPKELKLSIPDSEIASPGHYRQPFNQSLLLPTMHGGKIAPVHSNRQSKKTNNPANSRTVNVEAFRILMEVIKSLRELGIQNSTLASSSSEMNLGRISLI